MLSGATSRRITPYRRIAGVSLIEVLVSIVIASIGLLALAGVNATSVRYTKLSQYRGTATLLANDIGERMRANRAGLPSYSLETSFASQAALPGAAAVLCNDYTVTCTAAQVAEYDMQTWRAFVAHLNSFTALAGDDDRIAAAASRTFSVARKHLGGSS